MGVAGEVWEAPAWRDSPDSWSLGTPCVKTGKDRALFDSLGEKGHLSGQLVQESHLLNNNSDCFLCPCCGQVLYIPPELGIRVLLYPRYSGEPEAYGTHSGLAVLKVCVHRNPHRIKKQKWTVIQQVWPGPEMQLAWGPSGSKWFCSWTC